MNRLGKYYKNMVGSYAYFEKEVDDDYYVLLLEQHSWDGDFIGIHKVSMDKKSGTLDSRYPHRITKEEFDNILKKALNIIKEKYVK
jgi:hypothetical protein